MVWIKKALNEIGMSIQNGVNPVAVQPRVVKTETFDVFSKTYMDNQPTTDQNPKIAMFLNPLLANGGGKLSFKVVTHTHNYGDY
jgi:hypothetical protein